MRISLGRPVPSTPHLAELPFISSLLGNGHRDEAPEPQQPLFSWAEFMAEDPVKTKDRNQNPKHASSSLFEWAIQPGVGGGVGICGELDRRDTVHGKGAGETAGARPCVSVLKSKVALATRKERA